MEVVSPITSMRFFVVDTGYQIQTDFIIHSLSSLQRFISLRANFWYINIDGMGLIQCGTGLTRAT